MEPSLCDSFAALQENIEIIHLNPEVPFRENDREPPEFSFFSTHSENGNCNVSPFVRIYLTNMRVPFSLHVVHLFRHVLSHVSRALPSRENFRTRVEK